MAMEPARTRRTDPALDRLIVAAAGRVSLHAFTDLARFLEKGDVLVVNDAGTRPSSLHLVARVNGVPREVEARLLDHDERSATYGAVLFGAGDWHDDTDLRPPPPVVHAGDTLRAARGARAVVVEVSPLSPRLVRLRLDDALTSTLFEIGEPVQYSYMASSLRLSDVQTPYASRPWAAEMPSAGRALRTSHLVLLRRRGVEIARVTAAAGLSATGDPALDRLLPLPERYEIPADTAAVLARAQGRVVAVGTSTVRALESAVDDDGAVRAGVGTASLIIGPGFVPRAVDGILSGMHEAGTSHDSLLRAFAPAAVVDAVIELGRGAGLFVHELGDHCLVMRDGA